MWVILALASAVFLGIYEVFKKLSVQRNAVIPVLFLSTLTSSLIFLPIVVGSYFAPEFFNSIHLFIPEINLEQHGLILIKSVIVVASWILAFYEVKNLPITIVGPIRATGPIRRFADINHFVAATGWSSHLICGWGSRIS